MLMFFFMSVLQEHQTDLTFASVSYVSEWSFTMSIYQKIDLYLEAYINNQYIELKNNTAQLYIILGRAKLHGSFSSIPGF